MSKSAKILTFKVNFGCQKLIEFFQIQNLSKNVNLGDHYSSFFFLNSIFEPLHFLKLRPIFDRVRWCDPSSLKFHDRTDINIELWVDMLYFIQ